MLQHEGEQVEPYASKGMVQQTVTSAAGQEKQSVHTETIGRPEGAAPAKTEWDLQ